VVSISTPERPVFPALEFSKLDLARYYEQVAPWMLPHVVRRPLTLVRCERGVTKPDGLRSECKFLRHEAGFHRWAKADVGRVQIQEQHKLGEYLLIESPASLLAIVQGDILELHCWNSRAPNVEHPDRFVLDLDPGPGASWSDVLSAAKLVRQSLVILKLRAWPMLTGGKGLHLVVPVVPERSWDHVYAFTRNLAHAIALTRPDLFTSDFRKSARTNRVLIDYKRNVRGSVAVAPYSARANARGTVAVPVRWEELPKLQADQFTVRNLHRRLARLSRDPWHAMAGCHQRLPTASSQA
jgi:bifunctional non-homologous end joining protein LigD